MPNHEPEITFVSGFTLNDNDTPMLRPPERTPKPETVTLRGIQVPLTSTIGSAFISDCARNRERIFSDDRIIEKYDINPNDWTTITQNKALRLLVTAECERRMLSGIAAQESAAKIFTEEGPQTLGSIVRDQRASPRHRVDAARELRTAALFDDKKDTADATRFTITINLGNAPEDKLVVDCGAPKQPKEDLDAEKEWKE
jgi:hypothetical protein